MPSAGSAFAHKAKHQNHLRLLEYLMAHEFPNRLRECASMAQAYSLLLSAPSIGSFLSYQYVTDLNYSDATNFSETEFLVPGPGAIDGINKCFDDTSLVHPSDVIRYMYDHQEAHFAEQDLEF